MSDAQRPMLSLVAFVQKISSLITAIDKASSMVDMTVLAGDPNANPTSPHGLGLASCAHQIDLYKMIEPSLATNFTCTRRPRSSYQMSCEYRPLIA